MARETILHQADVEAVIAAKTANTATTAELASLTSAINIDPAKKAGRLVFNTTTGALVVAIGDTAAGVWNTAAGVLAHSPV